MRRSSVRVVAQLASALTLLGVMTTLSPASAGGANAAPAAVAATAAVAAPATAASAYFDESTPGTSLAPSTTADPDLATGVIGTVEYISGGNPIFPGPNGPGLDYAVIELDKTKVVPTATVGQVTIDRIGPPPGFGTIMCKQGRSSGLTCGMMLANTPPYFSHTIWEQGGDSGSPVAVGTTLVGNQWVAGGSTAMVSVVADLNARGGIGAGFTPVAP